MQASALVIKMKHYKEINIIMNMIRDNVPIREIYKISEIGISKINITYLSHWNLTRGYAIVWYYKTTFSRYIKKWNIHALIFVYLFLLRLTSLSVFSDEPGGMLCII